MLDLDEFWELHVGPMGLLETRPDFRFDPSHYARRNPDLIEAGLDPREHYENHGRAEERAATEYREILRQRPGFDAVLAEILTSPDLKAAIRDEQPDAAELAFEILALPGDLDILLSNFSKRHYIRRYPDVGEAGITPVRHYLEFGRKEGRSSLETIRRNHVAGARPFDPALPTLLLAVHEFSKTGAPVVALDLLRGANQTHNVIVLALRDGSLMEQFRKEATSVFITEMPHEEIDFVLGDRLAQVDYALLNSADTSPFIKMLVGRRIPFASYVHEYTQYSLPHHKTMFPSFFADLMIFSSEHVRDSWRGLHGDVGFDTEADSCIVPQADLHKARVSASAYAKARKTVGEVLGCDLTGKKLVYGAGGVHWRKGTDLFFMTAQIARKIDPDTVYVWIGDGLNREDPHIGVWMQKHMDEAGANMEGSSCHYIPAGNLYPTLATAADVMLLSSRMDPLPNVVFDAVKADCDVVMFENASGFDDATYDDQSRLHRVGYGMIQDAAQAIAGLSVKADRLSRRPGWPLSRDRKDGGTDLFRRIDDRIQTQLAARRAFYLGSGTYDLSLLYSARPEDAPYRAAERQKAWSLGRKTIWKSADEARAVLAASDHPVLRNCTVLPHARQTTEAVPDYSIHIHAHYVDDLENDLRNHLAFHRADTLAITTDSVEKSNEINSILKNVGLKGEILVVENQGRDILPFMRLFHDIKALGGGDVWAHVHQKKSLSTQAGGDVWRTFMLRILLGGPDHLSNAVTQMANPKVGLVSPFDPFICGWYGSKPVLPTFQSLIRTPLPEHPTLYPIGNMFWTRKAVVDRMNGFFGESYPWPNEPIANDGTVFHVIERLWPTAACEAGLGSIFIDKPDEPRR